MGEMRTVAIPAWTAEGVLPPVHPSDASADRSPYFVSLTDYVRHFGQTPERRTILDGLLRYRAAWHAAGVTRGLQWIDGSFLENVETIEGRPPNDVDVVTFFQLPDGDSQAALLGRAPDLFEETAVKAAYHVDGYWVSLGSPPERLLHRSAYWYSMWSHRRNQTWKGFVEIDLSPLEDAAAAASLVTEGGRP